MLYKQTFSKLTVNPQIIQEVIDMTETKKRPKKFILRRLIIVAAVLVLAFALAMGANAATGGELFEKVVTFVTYSSDGETFVVGVSGDALEGTDEMNYITVQAGEEDGSAFILYKDADGNTVKKDFDLKDMPEPNTDENGNIIMKEGTCRFSTESEVAAAEESNDVVGVGADENNQTIVGKKIS